MAKISGSKQNVLLPRWLNAYEENMFLKQNKKRVHFEMCFICCFHNTMSAKIEFSIVRETLKKEF